MEFYENTVAELEKFIVEQAIVLDGEYGLS